MTHTIETVVTVINPVTHRYEQKRIKHSKSFDRIFVNGILTSREDYLKMIKAHS